MTRSSHRHCCALPLAFAALLAACGGAPETAELTEWELENRRAANDPPGTVHDWRWLSVDILRGDEPTPTKLGDPAPTGGASSVTLMSEQFAANAAGSVVDCVAWQGHRAAPRRWLNEAEIELREPIAICVWNQGLVVRETNRPGLYIGTPYGQEDRFHLVVWAKDQTALMRLRSHGDAPRIDILDYDKLSADVDRTIADQNIPRFDWLLKSLEAMARMQPESAWAKRYSEVASKSNEVKSANQQRMRAEFDQLAAARAKDWPKLTPVGRYARLRGDLSRGNRLAAELRVAPWSDGEQLKREAMELRAQCIANQASFVGNLSETYWLWAKQNPDVPLQHADNMADACAELLVTNDPQAALTAFQAIVYEWHQNPTNRGYYPPVAPRMQPIGGLAASELAAALRRAADRIQRDGHPYVADWWRKGVADWIAKTMREGEWTKRNMPILLPERAEIEATIAELSALEARSKQSTLFQLLPLLEASIDRMELIEDKQPSAKELVRRGGSHWLRESLKAQAVPLRKLADDAQAKGLLATAAWAQTCAMVVADALPAALYYEFTQLYDGRNQQNADVRRFAELTAPLLAELGAPVVAATSNRDAVVMLAMDGDMPGGLAKLGIFADPFLLRQRLGLPLLHLAVRQNADGTASVVEQTSIPTPAEQWPEIAAQAPLPPAMQAEADAIAAEEAAITKEVEDGTPQANADEQLVKGLQREADELARERADLDARLPSMSPEEQRSAAQLLQQRIDSYKTALDRARLLRAQQAPGMDNLIRRMNASLQRRFAHGLAVSIERASEPARFDNAVRPAYMELLKQKLTAWQDAQRAKLKPGAELDFELECGAFFAGLEAGPSYLRKMTNEATTMTRHVALQGSMNRATDREQLIDAIAEMLLNAAVGPLQDRLRLSVWSDTSREAYQRGVLAPVRMQMEARMKAVDRMSMWPELNALLEQRKTSY